MEEKAFDDRISAYVISADIRMLLKNWTAANGFCLPDDSFFVELRLAFIERIKKIHPFLEFVSEEELSVGIKEIVSSSKLEIVSIDKTYYVSSLKLEMTRIYDAKMDRDVGVGRRANAPSIFSQFRKIREFGVSEVMLVDDVIFSGEGISRVAKAMENFGIKVPAICAGVGIGGGVKRLRDCGILVSCVREYGEVVDEVCERDFYPGIPFSGRLMYGTRNTFMPYVLPFGNPEKWASIPSAHVQDFSRFCLLQSIRLFEEIENVSERDVYCEDIGQHIVGLPRQGVRFVEALKSVL